MKNQDRVETIIARRFVELARPDIDLESIEKRRPPEPDVRCVTRDGRVVAFELVEIIDSDLAASMGKPGNLPMELTNEFRELVRDQPAERWNGLFATIWFQESASVTKRRSARSEIVGLIAKSQPLATGPLEIPPKIADIVRGIDLNWIRTDRPLLSVPCEACAIDDFPTSAISAKLTTKSAAYQFEGALELLAYVGHHPIPPRDIWEDVVRREISRLIQASRFDRVWVFDANAPSVLMKIERTSAAG